MAGKVLTEDDDAPPERTEAAGEQEPREPVEKPAADIEIVETPDGQPPETEARLTDEESGEQPLIDAKGERTDGKRKWPTKAERRERQRKAAAEKDQRLQAYERRLAEQEAEISALKGGMGQVLDGQAKDRLAQLQRALSDEEAKFNATEAQIVALAEGGDFKGAETLRRQNYASVVRGQQLQGQINQLRNGGQRQERQPQEDAPALTPRARSLGNAFMEKHSDWYGSDAEATEVVNAIDKRVTADGFDPGTKEYWDEVEARAAKRLPEYFGDGEPAPRNGGRQNGSRREPPTGGVGQGAPDGRKRVYLSPERKSALIEAGALDGDGQIANRKKFDRIMSGFQKYDAQNGAAR